MTKKSGVPVIHTVRAMDVCSFTGPSTRVLSRMRDSPAHQLIVVRSGIYGATVDTARRRETLRAEAGDVVFWPSGTDHTDMSESGRPLRCIVIWLTGFDPPAGLPFRARDTEHVIDLLAGRLLALAHEPDRKGVLGAEAHAYTSAILAEYLIRARVAADAMLDKVTHYTEEHIRDPIRLIDLARCAGLEKHHFSRKYRELTGRTPMQDVKRRKAAYAKHVLQLTPTRTLRSVGPFVGIANLATLSRLLTRYAGVSARDIKRAARPRGHPPIP